MLLAVVLVRVVAVSLPRTNLVIRECAADSGCACAVDGTGDGDFRAAVIGFDKELACFLEVRAARFLRLAIRRGVDDGFCVVISLVDGEGAIHGGGLAAIDARADGDDGVVIFARDGESEAIVRLRRDVAAEEVRARRVAEVIDGDGEADAILPVARLACDRDVDVSAVRRDGDVIRRHGRIAEVCARLVRRVLHADGARTTKRSSRQGDTGGDIDDDSIRGGLRGDARRIDRAGIDDGIHGIPQRADGSRASTRDTLRLRGGRDGERRCDLFRAAVRREVDVVVAIGHIARFCGVSAVCRGVVRCVLQIRRARRIDTAVFDCLVKGLRDVVRVISSVIDAPCRQRGVADGRAKVVFRVVRGKRGVDGDARISSSCRRDADGGTDLREVFGRMVQDRAIRRDFAARERGVDVVVHIVHGGGRTDADARLARLHEGEICAASDLRVAVIGDVREAACRNRTSRNHRVNMIRRFVERNRARSVKGRLAFVAVLLRGGEAEAGRDERAVFLRDVLHRLGVFDRYV